MRPQPNPTRLPRTADVVIVGGGVVGVSAAYHLAAVGAGRVVLVEREPAFGAGSTGRCAGGFRHQFSSRVNVELSLASIPLIVGFEATHGLPLDVVQDGYLFLVRGDAAWAGFRSAAGMQRGLGVDVRVLGPQDAAELVPGLDVDDVTGATYCPADGIADPSGLTLGYATIARRAGADLRTGIEATAIVTTADRLTRVETTDGPIDTETVIDAAGPWAGRLAAMAGVELPLEPIPRVVLVTAPFPGAPARKTLVIDAATSFYFHREAGGVLMGMGDPAERPTFETRVDERFVAEDLLPTAVRTFPPLADAAIARRWVGLYEMTPDRHPILGRAPELPGLILANGFSGHGFQHAPIVGKLLAELIVDGAARTVDISSLGLDRFADRRVSMERHVV
ncbi:MAG TPA: FAD-binding oxidoreductase [Patescibacteria group bacterium]|nr:FAD-binding oxidoreductase [Patescibacteria group bacterium]